MYFRRAATAFQIADFAKRAVAPLRTAWALAIEGLPVTSKLVVDLAVELMQLHKQRESLSAEEKDQKRALVGRIISRLQSISAD